MITEFDSAALRQEKRITPFGLSRPDFLDRHRFRNSAYRAAWEAAFSPVYVFWDFFAPAARALMICL